MPKKESYKIDGRLVELSNLDKVFWPEEGITKADLISYYLTIGKYLLPYIKNKPQSLNRYPNGINGKHFYQKNVTAELPNWIKTFIFARGEKTTRYILCQDLPSLIYVVNLGCIEINPWSAPYYEPCNPEWCVIDLDPLDIDFQAVIETALVTHEVTKQAGISTFCKTSGLTGLHIYIPLGSKYSYEIVKRFTKLICLKVNQKLPETTSLERSPTKRQGKIYLDFLQNNLNQTLASPYSVRPVKGAPVSTPLHWAEITKTLNVQEFNMRTVPKQLEKEGDIFSGVLKKGVDIGLVSKRLV